MSSTEIADRCPGCKEAYTGKREQVERTADKHRKYCPAYKKWWEGQLRSLEVGSAARAKLEANPPLF